MPNYEKKLYEKIAEVVSYVCNNPAVFVSEMDIHVLMMKALMEIKCLKKRYDTNCTIGMKSKDSKNPSKQKYKTMLVHNEYGNNTGKGQRNDIVIFDEKDIKSIDDPENLKRTIEKKKKYLEPKYIFEFGTEKSAKSKEKYEEHLKGDFEKLSKIKNKGFLIHIQRIYVKSHSETDKYKDNRKKILNYGKSTVKIWNRYKGKDWTSRIKVLIFFVDLGGEKRVVKEKVRMFNPYPDPHPNPKRNKDADWPHVNLKDIKEIIKNFLEEDKPDLIKIKRSLSKK